MTALAVVSVALRRMLRDRTAMFFVVVLPVAIILLIGLTVRGSGELRVGVVSPGTGPLAAQVGDALATSAALSTTTFATVDAARTSLRRGELAAVVVIPADVDSRLSAGTRVPVDLYAETNNTTGQAAASAVRAAVDEVGAQTTAARFAGSVTGVPFAEGMAAARRAASQVPDVVVRSVTVDAGSDILPQGFSYSAPTMLVLFVFINALAGGAAIVQTRRLGIYSRALAAPVRTTHLVAGETLAYLAIALLQSLLIVGVGALVFGVSWGDPLAAGLLVLAWALVGTGAGVLSGSVFRTPEQASAIGPTIGIAAGMLGGCMWPLAIVPAAMREGGHLLPHAWAVDAWTELLSRGGGVADIAPQLAVLTAFAAALLVLASWRLRARLLA